jgi:hypothetical protein
LDVCSSSTNCDWNSLLMAEKMPKYHVGVSAEAFAAALFARAGYHVSVQYGANQPGYDLIVEKDKKSSLISVKGSQDGGWGLTQTHLQKGKADYHPAIDKWLTRQGEGIIFCLVQFKNKGLTEMPEVFLATPSEIATQLKLTAGGHGDTILHVEKTWIRGKHAGFAYRIPVEWSFSQARVDKLLG